MHKRKILLFFSIALFLILSGCAKKTTVVLLTDPDGKVGHITVAGKAGAVDLTRQGEATVISGKESTPSPPETLSAATINKEFSQVLSILPGQPMHFLLYFKSETTELTVASQGTVPEILKSIEEKNSQFISIIGHSDTAGDPQYNLQLSRERALAVSRFLISKGIAPDFIESTYHGAENPIIKTADNVHEPRNRRVEMVIR